MSRKGAELNLPPPLPNQLKSFLLMNLGGDEEFGKIFFNLAAGAELNLLSPLPNQLKSLVLKNLGGDEEFVKLF